MFSRFKTTRKIYWATLGQEEVHLPLFTPMAMTLRGAPYGTAVQGSQNILALQHFLGKQTYQYSNLGGGGCLILLLAS